MFENVAAKDLFGIIALTVLFYSFLLKPNNIDDGINHVFLHFNFLLGVGFQLYDPYIKDFY